MKKLLLAALISTAFAGIAAAESSVTVYGRIDLGVGLSHVNDGFGKTTNKAEMESGGGTSNRIGIKGEEDLGKGYKIRFVLENGFDADTGAEGASGLAFSREATLQIVSPFGTLAAGRSSILGTDGGTFNMLGNVNPFGTGIWEIGNQNIVYGKMPASRFDNAFTYRSPEFKGLQFTAEYSMGEEGKENRSTSNHYFGAGVTWKKGVVNSVLLFERVNEALTTEKRNPKDMWRITGGGSLDFSDGTAYLSLQYFKNADAMGTAGYAALKEHGLGSLTSANIGHIDGLEGQNIIVGLSTPVWGGKLLSAVGYVHAKTTEFSDKLKINGGFLGVGYQYSITKRTKIYTALGASLSKYKVSDHTAKPKSYYGTFGMSHYF